ncbi:MAG: DUF4403 family protein [Nitrospinae bacterium]|nr:DUF4403 family protein [Nitrospinota bacterium]
MKRDSSPSAVLCALLLACAAGCGGGLGVPKPAFEAEAPEPDLPPEESAIEIPVTVHLDPILRKVEEKVPLEFNSKGWETVGTSPVGDVGVKYRVWRGPLQANLAGNKVTITVRLHYSLAVAHRLKAGLLAGGNPPWMQFGQCGDGGEAPREAVFSMETALAWAPDWKVRSKTKLLPNLYPNSCGVTALNFDITRAVDGNVRPRLEEAAKLIDERIPAAADFKKTAEEAWKRMQTPLRLEKDVWLLPNPREIYVTPIDGAGDRLATGIGIAGSPALAGGKMPAPGVLPLPELKTGPKGNGTFRVALKAELDFDAAAEQLHRRLAEKPVVLGKRRVTITGVTIYPSKERCVIQLGLKGDVDGVIYFMGEPVYDEAKGLLSLDKLDYTLETENVLHTAAEWLLHDDFRAEMRKQAQWRMDTGLKDARGKIEQALNIALDEHATLRAEVKELYVRRFFMGRKGFRADIVVQGTAAVAWK